MVSDLSCVLHLYLFYVPLSLSFSDRPKENKLISRNVSLCSSFFGSLSLIGKKENIVISRNVSLCSSFFGSKIWELSFQPRYAPSNENLPTFCNLRIPNHTNLFGLSLRSAFVSLQAFFLFTDGTEAEN